MHFLVRLVRFERRALQAVRSLASTCAPRGYGESKRARVMTQNEFLSLRFEKIPGAHKVDLAASVCRTGAGLPRRRFSRELLICSDERSKPRIGGPCLQAG